MRSVDATTLDRPVLNWLASEAALGSESALRELLRRLHRPVLVYIARRVGHPADAQDAWQETAVVIARDLHRLRDTGSVRAWAFRIAHHKAMDILRERSRRSETVMDDSLSADGESPDRLLDAAALLARLSPDDQSLMSLFYLHGFTLAEIAEVLAISPGAARVRLFRAREKLKSMMEGETHESSR